ncbi:SRPBCC domain-containing protein [Sphingobacterium sp. SGL-16]|uniref:SRPBCC domain-containing protein n=1 Tax=Sphingobacterium sp. SGL-16 TaxID=2710883 RepID=UPI0013EAF10E|nr:SRPBCC domain-containing protein [Sphingobacterium sp. SGL-16]NGM73668.1 hypothetical protein [Sphingobacterium sp. SGL-16]
MEKTVVHIEAEVNAPLQKVWDDYNSPQAITKWNQASADWYCPSSTVDLRTGGRFQNRMEAKNGSFGFDFEGEYLEVLPLQKIVYRMDDDRKVWINFIEEGDNTRLKIDFEAEDMNPVELQKEGWQAILNSFKNYTENN